MSKIENQENYIVNSQFSGGTTSLFVSGSEFDSYNQNNPQFGFIAGGMYVGQTGTLVCKTIDGSILSFVSASGFIPGLITAVSSSSTCGSVVALK